MAKRKREWLEIGEPLPAPVMDNHTHLPVHEGEIPSPGGVRLSLEDQLARAREVRVSQIITVGCSVPDLQPTLDLAHQWSEVKAALAIHPNDAAIHAGHIEKSPDGLEHERRDHHQLPLIEALERVAALLGDPEVVAVGETGLDYFRTGPAGREAQKESFRVHLEMARTHNLPLQIHDREAHADTLEILADAAWKDQVIVFHCYSGDAEMAQVLAKNGWYASFAGPLNYPANQDLRDALLALPPELVMVETDAPYLTPAPFRGCPNASYLLPYTVQQVAELWDVSLEAAANRLHDTSVGVYGSW